MFLNNNESGILSDVETGEKIADVKELSSADIVSEEPYQIGTKYPMRIMESEYEITFSCDLDSAPDFQKIFGLDTARFPDSYNISYVAIVQARKHKKKRINKKWLKRYGYKQKLVKLDGFKIKSYCDDGAVELVKDE